MLVGIGHRVCIDLVPGSRLKRDENPQPTTKQHDPPPSRQLHGESAVVLNVALHVARRGAPATKQTSRRQEVVTLDMPSSEGSGVSRGSRLPALVRSRPPDSVRRLLCCSVELPYTWELQNRSLICIFFIYFITSDGYCRCPIYRKAPTLP